MVKYIWTYNMFMTSISIKTTKNDDDRRRHFELSYVFAMSEVRLHLYVYMIHKLILSKMCI